MRGKFRNVDEDAKRCEQGGSGNSRGETAALAVLVVGGLFSVAPVRAEFTSPEEGSVSLRKRSAGPRGEMLFLPQRRCGKAERSLQVDHLSHLLAGGDTGPSLVPGKPDESLLVEAIAYGNPDLRMPPKENFPPPWSRISGNGSRAAHHGRGTGPQAGKSESFDLEKRRAEHWSWRPVVQPPFPRVKDKAWLSSPVDAFLLAKIEAAGLRPAQPADDRTWLRRVSFDLTGLPPTKEQTDAFLADPSTERREKVVDALLASPHFGEKWARHWMDLVRYAETHGHEFDFPIDHAFEYRDYLIRAFNDDVPFRRLCQGTHRGRPPCESAPPREGGIQRIRPRDRLLVSERGNPLAHGRLADESDHQANQIDVYGKAFLAHRLVCPLPRSQVRRDLDRGLLRPHRIPATAAPAPSGRWTRVANAPPPRRNSANCSRRRMRPCRKLRKVRHGMNPTPPSSPILKVTIFRPDGPSSARRLLRRERPPRFTLEEGRTLTTPGTVSSARLGEAHSGVLRSPTFTIGSDVIHVRLRARGG